MPLIPNAFDILDASISTIKKRNGLNSDQLKIGPLLLIPDSEGSVITTAKIKQYDTVSHVVNKGGSLSTFALKYKTTVKNTRVQNGRPNELIR